MKGDKDVDKGISVNWACSEFQFSFFFFYQNILSSNLQLPNVSYAQKYRFYLFHSPKNTFRFIKYFIDSSKGLFDNNKQICIILS